MGVIVGPILAVFAVAVALIVFIYYWRKRKVARRHRSSVGDIAPFPQTGPPNGDVTTPAAVTMPATREKSSRFGIDGPRTPISSALDSVTPPSSDSGAVHAGNQTTFHDLSAGPISSPRSPQSQDSSVYHSAPSTHTSPRMALDNQLDINRIVELVAQRIDHPAVISRSDPPPEYPVG